MSLTLSFTLHPHISPCANTFLMLYFTCPFSSVILTHCIHALCLPAISYEPFRYLASSCPVLCTSRSSLTLLHVLLHCSCSVMGTLSPLLPFPSTLLHNMTHERWPVSLITHRQSCISLANHGPMYLVDGHRKTPFIMSVTNNVAVQGGLLYLCLACESPYFQIKIFLCAPISVCPCYYGPGGIYTGSGVQMRAV